MAKQKFEVVRPWFGKKVGDIVEVEKLNPAFAANVRPLRGQVADAVNGKQEPETVEVDLNDKAAVMAELKRRKIPYDGRKSVEELAELLTQPAAE